MEEQLRKKIQEAAAKGMTADQIEAKIIEQDESLREDEEARAVAWLYARSLQP